MLTNRVVLVTGASRGIGAATAKLLAQNGAAVAINYARSDAAAQTLLSEIQASGGRAMLVKADVTVQAEVQAMVAEVEQKLGPIDTIVLNASIGFPIVPFTKYPWDAFEAKLTGELKAAFFCVRAVVDGMIARKNGCIIAVSSGLSRHPGFGFCAHSTAKSALDAFVKSLAFELGPHGIRVNTVAPGLTITDATAFIPEEQKAAAASHTPLRRNGLPEDIAGAILMVASQNSRFITGNYIAVDGGNNML